MTVASFSLVSMPARKIPKKDKPAYGLALAARRTELGKSALDIENETNGVIYQKLLYRMEGGHKDPLKLHIDKFSTLLSALDWTPEEFSEETGLELPPALRDAYQADPGGDWLEQHGVKPNFAFRIPVYGSLAAGIKGFEIKEEPDYYRVFSKEELPRGVDPSKLYLVKANGDSMYEEGIRRPIPDGAWLMVEHGAMPADGEVVVAYIPDLELGVVKQYRRSGEDVLLRSYKPGGPVFWCSQYSDIRIQGVVKRVTYEL